MAEQKKDAAPKAWPDLMMTDTAPKLYVRIAWRVAAFLFIILLSVGIWFLRDSNVDINENRRIQKQVSNTNTSKSLNEHMRTQTLICLAHPEINGPAFRQICDEVLKQWELTPPSQE